MPVNRPIVLFICGLLTSAAFPLSAEELTMPDKDSYQVADAPARGSLQSDVLKQLGEPASKKPGVGKPLISSWIYPEFKVFFENDRVIHTVQR